MFTTEPSDRLEERPVEAETFLLCEECFELVIAAAAVLDGGRPLGESPLVLRNLMCKNKTNEKFKMTSFLPSLSSDGKLMGINIWSKEFLQGRSMAMGH